MMNIKTQPIIFTTSSILNISNMTGVAALVVIVKGLGRTYTGKY